MAEDHQEEREYHGLKTWFSKTTTELFKTAVNQVIISRMIAKRRIFLIFLIEDHVD